MPSPVLIPTRRRPDGFEKALQLVGNRPMLSYTIEAAQQAQRSGPVFVATNSAAAIEIARSMGAGYIRLPDELCSDTRPSFFSIKWVMENHPSLGSEPVIIARPTNPLRRGTHIDEAFELLKSTRNADSLVSVTRAEGCHPVRLKYVRDGLLNDVLSGEHGVPSPRQSHEEVYLRNGAIYITTPDLVSEGRLWGNKCCAFIMDEVSGFNINSLEDLWYANFLLGRGEKER